MAKQPKLVAVQAKYMNWRESGQLASQIRDVPVFQWPRGGAAAQCKEDALLKLACVHCLLFSTLCALIVYS